MESQLKQRYNKLIPDREHYLERARDASKLTIPSLIREDGDNPTTEYETPWQSVGARGTNNLSSKILLALFPPSSPFFRMKISEDVIAEMGAKKGAIEKDLATFERIVADDIEHTKTRSSLYQAARNLIVAGNALLYDDPETNKVKMYKLDRYVVQRDSDGEVYEMIATDPVRFAGLPLDIQQLVTAAHGEKKVDEKLTIYTGIYRQENKWVVFQEVDDVVIPDRRREYKLDQLPWIPLRFTAVDDESYGRGFIEELYGDLNTLDVLTQAVTESAAAGAIVKFLVNPSGVTEVRDLKETPNGGFASGFEGDVSVLQVGKFADLRVAMEQTNKIEERLSLAFLLHSSVQRNAERVTAEEIRFMASELEDALGGLYTVLSQELQLPLVKSRIARLQKAKRLPALPKGIEPSIITGLEALGRGHELQRLRMFVADAAQTYGPEVVSEYVEVAEHLRRSAAALNLNTDGLVRDEDVVQERRQQRAELEAQMMAASRQPPEGGQ
jgi:hypothetical protein